MPQLIMIHTLLLVAYPITYLIGLMPKIVMAAALIVGILRKTGMPKMNMEYAQSFMFAEDFQTLAYLMSIAMSGSSLFVNMPLLITAASHLAIDFKRMLNSNPNIPLLSNERVKDYINRGSTHEMQDYARMVKADVEVYVGFYLIIGIFVGASNMMGAIFYWQMMRMRYMISPAIQSSFVKIDYQI